MDLVQLRPLLVVLRKAKICNFVGLMFDQYVGRFQIPVDNRMLVQIFVPPNELFHDDQTLRFRQFLSLLKNVL